MSHARETTLTFVFIMYLSPLNPKSCAFYNFDILRHILIIFGRELVSNSRCVTCKSDNLGCLFFFFFFFFFCSIYFP